LLGGTSEIGAYVRNNFLTTAAQARSIQDYPEARAYGDCVIAKARVYAAQSDPVFDLAIAAVSACRPEQNAMERALRAENTRRFVDTFMYENKRSMIEVASEVIVETRRHTRR